MHTICPVFLGAEPVVALPVRGLAAGLARQHDHVRLDPLQDGYM
jgi:hypothetical protein